MAVTYSRYSPYRNTVFYGNFLDVANLPEINPGANDLEFVVNKTYEHRPDLLAYDLYGNADFWWVFAIRNPNVIKDPVWDMMSGVTIFLPKKENIISALG